MKTLWTACYSRARTIPPEFTQVRTSRGVPRWWTPARRVDAMPLAPNAAVFAAAKADWQAAYRRQLDDLYRTGVLERVVASLPDNAVLLCFEVDARECHRSILAAYLVEKGLAVVKEYVAAPAEPQEPNAQFFLL